MEPRPSLGQWIRGFRTRVYLGKEFVGFSQPVTLSTDLANTPVEASEFPRSITMTVDELNCGNVPLFFQGDAEDLRP